jgi:hypothetical protein
MEFELEAAVVGEVVIVADELDECHALYSTARKRAAAIIAIPDSDTQESQMRSRLIHSASTRLNARVIEST